MALIMFLIPFSFSVFSGTIAAIAFVSVPYNPYPNNVVLQAIGFVMLLCSAGMTKAAQWMLEEVKWDLLGRTTWL